MDPFVAQLARLCATHRTRAKWVFVPTHAHRPHARRPARPRGHRLGQPPVRHAARHRAPHGRAVPRRARHRSVRRGTRSGADDAAAPRPAARRAATSGRSPISRRWRRRCGRRCASCGWRECAPSDSDRTRSRRPRSTPSSCALLRAYETLPRRPNKRGDMATVYEEAVRHPDWCPIQPQDCWTELPDAHLDSAPARLDRQHAGRARRAARVRARRRRHCRAVCGRARRTRVTADRRDDIRSRS